MWYSIFGFALSCDLVFCCKVGYSNFGVQFLIWARLQYEYSVLDLGCPAVWIHCFFCNWGSRLCPRGPIVYRYRTYNQGKSKLHFYVFFMYNAGDGRVQLRAGGATVKSFPREPPFLLWRPIFQLLISRPLNQCPVCGPRRKCYKVHFFLSLQKRALFLSLQKGHFFLSLPKKGTFFSMRVTPRSNRHSNYWYTVDR